MPFSEQPFTATNNGESKIEWFAMSAPYRRELKARDFLNAKGIENFVPMTKAIVERKGQKRKELIPAVHNLIFVHTTKEIIKSVKQGADFLQFCTRPVNGKNLPITVPDKEMEQFISVTQARIDDISYLSADEADLTKGTKVRIHGGTFDGIEGVFVKIKGKRRRRVVVLIEGLAAVAINAEITPDLIEVL